jgi:hypothetical protein
LLATLLHEITHLYDRAQLWSPANKHLLQECHRHAQTLGLVGLPEQCRGQTARRFTLSDDPVLLDLAGWPQRVARRGARAQANHQDARSPDSYELSNPREFIAVNMEYFLLDPSYACRRPSLARYLREHFAWSPVTSACSDELANLNAGRDFSRQPVGRIDPEGWTSTFILCGDGERRYRADVVDGKAVLSVPMGATYRCYAKSINDAGATRSKPVRIEL